ncbi:MAG: MATE family efflux transporter, partial [Firmicutes bacterium]|nr:MATE family efflux transporter [Bacillota bacterium]
SFWVGQFLGPQALAAVSVGFPIIFALIAMVTGITMATTTLVSQYFGAQQIDKVHRTINNSLVLLVGMGIVLSIVGIGYRDLLLRLIQTPDDIFPLASMYMGIFLTGLVPTFLYNAAGAILRGLGDSRNPLKFLAYATVMNIVLDPLLSFGFGPVPPMGVAGVALATVIAQAFSAVMAMGYLVRHSGLVRFSADWWRLDGEIMALTFKIGVPAGLQQMLVSFSHLFIGSLVNRFGSTVVAAFGVASRWDQFAFMPSMSVGMAVSALVGQNLGAGKDERVREIVKWSILLGGGITLLVTAIVLSIPGTLVRFFTDDAAVIAAGITYLRIVAFNYVPFAAMFVMGGVMRGAGDTIATFFASLLNLWGVRVPLAAYLSSRPELGIKGVWIAMMVSPYVGTTIQALYYKSGLWRKRALVRRSTQQEN